MGSHSNYTVWWSGVYVDVRDETESVRHLRRRYVNVPVPVAIITIIQLMHSNSLYCSWKSPFTSQSSYLCRKVLCE